MQVQFARKLAEECVPEWAGAYVNYAGLKNCADLLRGRDTQTTVETETPYGETPAAAEECAFFGALDAEVRKANDFFVKNEGQFYSRYKDIIAAAERCRAAAEAARRGVASAAGTKAESRATPAGSHSARGCDTASDVAERGEVSVRGGRARVRPLPSDAFPARSLEQLHGSASDAGAHRSGGGGEGHEKLAVSAFATRRASSYGHLLDLSKAADVAAAQPGLGPTLPRSHASAQQLSSGTAPAEHNGAARAVNSGGVHA
jgi:hypothetical protein